MSKNSSRDRSSLCHFTFADGHRCTLPQSADDMGLCYFHAKKFADRKGSEIAARKISYFLERDIVTTCDLSAAFNAVFAATAQGVIKPKTASTLTYLGHLMLETQQLAKKNTSRLSRPIGPTWSMTPTPSHVRF